MELPTLDPFLRTLPPSPIPYAATLDVVHDVFVARAPFQNERQVVFDALVVYATCVWGILPGARLWIDGGFLTLKDWAAPADVDVAVVVDKITPQDKGRLATRGLLTFATVTAEIDGFTLPAFEGLKPMGGLVDAYLATSATQEVFKWQWSRVRGPDGLAVPDAMKGFVEVSRDE